jgi:hypothetical protein
MACLLAVLLVVAFVSGHASSVPATSSVPAPGKTASVTGSGRALRAFMEDQLPLEVVLTTPTDIALADPGVAVGLYGRQTLTVRALCAPV